MNKKVFFSMFLATAGLLWTGCTNEEDGLNPKTEEGGESSYVSLTITDESAGAVTRNATDGTEATEGTESDVDTSKGLKVIIFKANGSIEKAELLTLSGSSPSGPYTSQAFEITAEAGKHIFVFANDDSNVSLPSGGSMTNFMEQAIPITLTNTNLNINTIGSQYFLMGSLWRESVTVEAGGTTAAPKSINLKIGRLSSKVNLKSVTTTNVSSNISGTFHPSDIKYRLGTIPKNINTVGVHQGSNLPIGSSNTSNKGVVVLSKVHSIIPDNTDPSVVSNAFYSFNTDWSTANAFNTAYYSAENTTALDPATNQQYFGTTTFIQMQTIYTPGTGEVRSASDLSQDGSMDGTTFWAANLKSDPTVRVLISNPNSITLDSDIDDTTIREYQDGKNYHKFAIFDTEEENDVCKYRVLRNHYYDFDVIKFNDLGEHTDIVDPEEPLPTTTTVEIEVTVKQWDKVAKGEVEVG